MKRVLAILVAVVMIASGMHLSIDRHYCGGTLADVKISFTGKLASCGMEQTESECSGHPAIDQKCCEDQLSFVVTSSNYCPEYFKVTHQISEKEIILNSESGFIACNLYIIDKAKRAFPPGDHPGKRQSQSDICVFRI